MIKATMELIEIPETGTKCLAGVDDEGDWTFVLLKETKTRFRLHCSSIGTTEQQLRSFLSADQSETNELIRAILETVKTMPRKPRRRKAKR